MVENQELEKIIGEFMREQGKMEQAKKVRNYKELNSFAQKGQILFTGSSLMEQFPVNEYAVSFGLNKIVYNRGIGGTTTDDFIREIDTVLFDLEPSKLFINIGTNDINERADGNPWQEHLLNNLEYIYSEINKRLPNTKVYVMAYYPINDELDNAPEWTKYMFKTRTNANLIDTNSKVEKLAIKHGFEFIDVNDGIKDAKGRLRSDYTVEGMHMYAGGYESIYRKIVENYI